MKHISEGNDGSEVASPLYPIYIHNNQSIIILQIYRVSWAHRVGYLFDDIVPLHGVVIAYGCSDRKLIKIYFSEGSARGHADGRSCHEPRSLPDSRVRSSRVHPPQALSSEAV